MSSATASPAPTPGPGENSEDTRAKVVSAAGLTAARDALGAAGKRLVFTNGCFDLLHAGHVRYLQGARSLGDALAIGLNADGSVRALKGPGRPLNSAEDRAEVLAALACVDYVTIFDEPRAARLLAAVRPHVYVKGGDYRLETLDAEERTALENAGSEIRFVPMVPGRSTTRLVDLMREDTTAMSGNGHASGSTHGHGNHTLTLGIIGSGKGSNGATIIREIEAGRLAARVGVVVSDVADAGILELARAHGLPAVHLPPGPFKTKLDPETERRLVEILRAHGVDLVVLAGFMRLLKQPMIEAFPRRIINIHPSLLPKFPGLAAWRQALEAGERETGCTIHHVDLGMDTGAPIAQATVPVLPGDTPETLHARIQEAEHRLYPEVIARFARGHGAGNGPAIYRS